MFRSGDTGAGLLVYALGAFSRALAVIRAAASSMRLDVLDLVIGLPGAPGFSGSGGGALSGSELSHLCRSSAFEASVASPDIDSHWHRTPTRLGKGVLMLHDAGLSTVPGRVPGRGREGRRHGQCLAGKLMRNAAN